MTDELIGNARVSDHRSRSLVSAAVAAGANRPGAQLIAMIYAEGPSPHSEADPLIPETDLDWGRHCARSR